MGKVYLVGAGPGDAGLLTIKGMERLRECDAVIYDRLASEELLEYTGGDCEKIYVGKQAGKHSKRQDEINRLLVECAKRHQCVVRLKGGDSFVFGRGGEEIEALEEAGIPYELVPGVTSAVAVPECAGIPVTHRGVSRSFHVITGHTEHSEGSPDYDYNLLAGLEGTLVFLMGLSNLEEIAQRLMDAGMARDTPAAVVACGTTDRQAAVRGSIADIAFRAEQSGMVPPAVIVIGKTAACRYHYCGKTSQRVGVTATKALQKKLEREFAAIGMEAVPVCDMKIVKTGQMARLRQELGHLEEYQWVVFTSQNAVSVFFEEMRDCRIDIRRLGGVKFAALGSGTADKLWEYGIAADFIPSSYTVQVFAEEFVESISEGDKVLIPRAVQGSAVLTDVLERHHVAFLNLAIYDVTGCPAEHIGMLEGMEYLVFVSASGVQEFFRLIRENAVTLPERIKIACIGGVTAKRLEECYREADIVADTSDVNGLAPGNQQLAGRCQVKRFFGRKEWQIYVWKGRSKDMVRMRRLRVNEAMRSMVRENYLNKSDLVYPIFIIEGENIKNPVDSMPGIFQYSIDRIGEELDRIIEAGIGAVLVFGIPAHKDEMGSEAYNDEGVIQRAVRYIKEEVPDLLVIADVCLCEYTSHGHCGLIHGQEILNDETLELLGKMSVSLAKAGADIIAPSDMMDGRVEFIRNALDRNGFKNTAIMAYSAKFASGYYSPFRDAAHSAPSFGDRKTYQMDPANGKEAVRECEADIAEGADIIMVKPALAYLDVVKEVSERTDYPIAAYNVSGEYSMVKAASQNGWIDEKRVVMENLIAMKRAGAKIIITYHALDAAAWMQEE